MYDLRDAGRKAQRLQHPRLGAVSAGADRRAARRQTGARLSGHATIRSSWRAPRSICRPGAPAAWRATSSSTDSKADAAILPRIVALGDLDEDEIAFAEAATGELAEAALALPPAFGALERRLPLAELISKWAAADRARARRAADRQYAGGRAALADELARLMDDMTTRQVPWDNLDKLVPDDLDEYWQQSLDFLKFVHAALARNSRRAERHRIRPSAATN